MIIRRSEPKERVKPAIEKTKPRTEEGERVSLLSQLDVSTPLSRLVERSTPAPPASKPTEAPFDPNERWNWNDGIDYDAIAKAVLKRMNGGDPDSQPYYIVYNVDYSVGFANQFRSLCSIFLMAVVTGRKLRSESCSMLHHC